MEKAQIIKYRDASLAVCVLEIEDCLIFVICVLCFYNLAILITPQLGDDLISKNLSTLLHSRAFDIIDLIDIVAHFLRIFFSILF